MKNNNYIVIQGWMVNDLHLKGNDLLIFAIIYGFSQDGQTRFTGSLKYLEKASGASRNTVIKSVKKLIDLDFLLKHEQLINGIKFCHYYHNELVVQKLTTPSAETDKGSAETARGGSAETAPNNTNIYNTNNNTSNKSSSDEIVNFTDFDEKQIDLFGNGPEKEKEKKVPAKKEKVSNEIIFPLVRELSKHFDKRILDNLSKSDKKNWCDTVEKLIRIDGYTHEEIKRAVKNARSDSFWSDKFLSLVKLRKKKPGEPTYIERFLRLNKTNDDNIGSNNFVYNPSKKANLL